MNQGSIIVVLTRLWAGRSGFRIRAQARGVSFLEKRTDWVWDPPSLLLIGYWGGLFLQGWEWPVPWLRMSGAIPPLILYASMARVSVTLTVPDLVSNYIGVHRFIIDLCVGVWMCVCVCVLVCVCGCVCVGVGECVWSKCMTIPLWGIGIYAYEIRKDAVENLQLQITTNKMQRFLIYLFLQTLYMFQAVPLPIIRSA